MESEITKITALAFATTFLLVMKPLISVFAKRLQDKINGTNGYSRMEQRLNRLENNHLTDIEKRIDRVENRMEVGFGEFREKIEDLNVRVAKIETKLNNRLTK